MPSGKFLPEAINALHMAASERKDADGVSVISKCLAALTALQAKDHQAARDGNQQMQAVMSRLGGGAPPQGGDGGYGGGSPLGE